jgi:hypothetical protein
LEIPIVHHGSQIPLANYRNKETHELQCIRVNELIDFTSQQAGWSYSLVVDSGKAGQLQAKSNTLKQYDWLIWGF